MNATHRHFGFLTAMALLSGLAGACSAELGNEAGGGPDCVTYGCPNSYTCSANGICIPDTPETFPLSLRITPLAGSNLPEEHRLNLQVRGGARLGDIVLNAPTAVMGTVIFRDNGAVVGSHLSFRRLDTISGITVKTEIDTNALGAYEVRLLPGRYRVTATPNALTVPPFFIEEVNVSGATLVFNVAPPDSTAYYRVTGRLVREVADGEPADLVPIGSAEVSFQSGDTGAIVSTTAETDANGQFSVLVTPGARGYVLRTKQSAMNDLVPSLSLPAIELDATTELGDVIAGTWSDPIDVDGTVIGQNGTGIPVVGATVFFRRTLEHGSFTHLARANEEGSFNASVIQGNYHVTVVPPADATYGAAAFDEELDTSGRRIGANLSHKLVVSGVALGPDGEPVEGVLVEAEPTGYDVESLSLVPSTAPTDEDGGFSLAVHPGSQRLRFRPPAESGLAPRIAELDTVSDGQRVDVTLADASTVTGLLREFGGAPLAEAKIEAYLETEDGPLLFATVTTDENGGFVINLPTLGL